MKYAPHDLLPHQISGLKAMHRYGYNCLLADDMGLGKTTQAAYALRHIIDTTKRPGLVVCPASLKYMWQRELYQQCGLTSDVLSGRKVDEAGLFGSSSHVSIINYDILHSWQPYLEQAGYSMSVFDECQAIRNPDNRRSMASHAVSRTTPHVIGCSGTPIENSPRGVLAHSEHGAARYVPQ